MECGKAGLKAVSFTTAAMGTEWSQRSEQITRPVYKPNTLDSAGAEPDGGSGF